MQKTLYPHNQAAYEKVMKAFETTDRTCICHPTGTGKSYIVAAVCEHFNRVLILAPNIFVLNQQQKTLKNSKGITYMTYPGLLNRVWDMKPIYDLIVLDEFHRVGADEWGAAVQLLLESQPQAKILGTSATPIRYLDNERNMAEEVFHGNVASELSIAEAWHLNILPIPTYVTGFFSFDKVVNDNIERINNSKSLNKEEKRNRIFRFNNMRLDWEKSNGMVSILQKHLSKDSHHIIVFCPHIESLSDLQDLAKKWFKQAGFKVSGTYMVHSKQTDNEQIERMRDFSENLSSGIKLMFAVNVLNEGVHVPNVDTVIMLRTTSSRVVYMQQLGRCLTAVNSGKPLILDMVDNITTTTAIRNFANEFEELEKKDSEYKEWVPRHFEIHDYTLSIQQVIKKLVPHYNNLSVEERILIVKTFCEEHGFLPMKSEYKETYHYKWLHYNCPNNPDFIALKKQYKKRYLTISERLKRLNNFITKYKRLPIQKEKEEYSNWKEILHYCRKNKDPHIKDIIDNILKEYSVIKDNERIKKELKNFVSTHKRLPCTIADKRERYLRAKIVSRNLHKTDLEIKKIWKKYDTTPIRYASEEKIVNMQEFTKKYKRKPHKNEPEYKQWETMLFYCKDDERVKILKEKYGGWGLSNIEVEQRAQQVIDFFTKNGHFPSSTKDQEKHLTYLMQNLIRRHSDNPKVQELIELKNNFCKNKNDTRRNLHSVCSKDNQDQLPTNGVSNGNWQI